MDLCYMALATSAAATSFSNMQKGCVFRRLVSAANSSPSSPSFGGPTATASSAEKQQQVATAARMRSSCGRFRSASCSAAGAAARGRNRTARTRPVAASTHPGLLAAVLSLSLDSQGAAAASEEEGAAATGGREDLGSSFDSPATADSERSSPALHGSMSYCGAAAAAAAAFPDTAGGFDGGSTGSAAAAATAFLDHTYFANRRRRRSSSNSDELLGEDDEHQQRERGGSAAGAGGAAAAAVASASPRSLLSIETAASDDCASSTLGCCSPPAETHTEAAAAALVAKEDACAASSPSASSSACSQTALLAVVAAAVASHAGAETPHDAFSGATVKDDVAATSSSDVAFPLLMPPLQQQQLLPTPQGEQEQEDVHSWTCESAEGETAVVCERDTTTHHAEPAAAASASSSCGSRGSSGSTGDGAGDGATDYVAKSRGAASALAKAAPAPGNAVSTASTADKTPAVWVADQAASPPGEADKEERAAAGVQQQQQRQVGEEKGERAGGGAGWERNASRHWWQLVAAARLFPGTRAQQAEVYLQLLESLAACRPEWRLKFNSHAFFFHIFRITKATSVAELQPYQEIFNPLLQQLGLHPARISAGFAAWTLRYAFGHASQQRQQMREQQGHEPQKGSKPEGSSGGCSSAEAEAAVVASDAAAAASRMTAATCHTTAGASAVEESRAQFPAEGASAAAVVRGEEGSVADAATVSAAAVVDSASESFGDAAGATEGRGHISSVAASSLPAAEALPAAAVAFGASTPSFEGGRQFLLLLRSTYKALDALYTASAAEHCFRLTPRLSAEACGGGAAVAIDPAALVAAGGLTCRGGVHEQQGAVFSSSASSCGGSFPGTGATATASGDLTGGGAGGWKTAATAAVSAGPGPSGNGTHVIEKAVHSGSGAAYVQHRGVRAAAAGGICCSSALSTAASVARFFATPISRFDIAGRRAVVEPATEEPERQQRHEMNCCCATRQHEGCCRGEGAPAAGTEGRCSGNCSSNAHAYRRRERASAAACRQLLFAYRNSSSNRAHNIYPTAAPQQHLLRRRLSQHTEGGFPGSCNAPSAANAKRAALLTTCASAAATTPRCAARVAAGAPDANDADADASASAASSLHYDSAATADTQAGRRHTGGDGAGDTGGRVAAAAAAGVDEGVALTTCGLPGSSCGGGKKHLRRRPGAGTVAAGVEGAAAGGGEVTSHTSRVSTAASSPFCAPLRQQWSVVAGAAAGGRCSKAEQEAAKQVGSDAHTGSASVACATAAASRGGGGRGETATRQPHLLPAAAAAGEDSSGPGGRRSRRGPQISQWLADKDAAFLARSGRQVAASSADAAGTAGEAEEGRIAVAGDSNAWDGPAAAAAATGRDRQLRTSQCSSLPATTRPAGDSTGTEAATRAAADVHSNMYTSDAPLRRERGGSDSTGSHAAAAAATTAAGDREAPRDGEGGSLSSGWSAAAAVGGGGGTGVCAAAAKEESVAPGAAADAAGPGSPSGSSGLATALERKQQQHVLWGQDGSTLYGADVSCSSSSRGESCVSRVSNSSSRDGSVSRNSEDETAWLSSSSSVSFSSSFSTSSSSCAGSTLPAFQLFRQGWWSVPVAKEEPPLDRAAGAALAAALPPFPGVVYVHQEHSFFALWRVKDGAPQRRRCDCSRLGVREAHRQAVQTVCRLTRRPPGVVYDSKSGKWSVCVTRHNGRHRASFSVKKFGFEGAHEKALEWYEAKRLQLGLLEPPVKGDSSSYIEEIRRAVGEEDPESLLQLFAAAVDAAPAAVPQQEAAAAAWAAAAPDPRFPHRAVVLPSQQASPTPAAAAGARAGAAAGPVPATEVTRKKEPPVAGGGDTRDGAARKRMSEVQQQVAASSQQHTPQAGAGNAAAAAARPEAGMSAAGAATSPPEAAVTAAVVDPRRGSATAAGGVVRKKGGACGSKAAAAEKRAGGGSSGFRAEARGSSGNAKCLLVCGGGGAPRDFLEQGSASAAAVGIQLQQQQDDCCQMDTSTAGSEEREEEVYGADLEDDGNTQSYAGETNTEASYSSSSRASTSSSCCDGGQLDVVLQPRVSTGGRREHKEIKQARKKRQQQPLVSLPSAARPAAATADAAGATAAAGTSPPPPPPVGELFAAEEGVSGVCAALRVETVSKEQQQQQMEHKGSSLCCAETPSSIQTFLQDSDQSPSVVSSTTAGALSPPPSCCFDGSAVSFCCGPEEEKRIFPSPTAVAASAYNRKEDSHASCASTQDGAAGRSLPFAAGAAPPAAVCTEGTAASQQATCEDPRTSTAERTPAATAVAATAVAETAAGGTAGGAAGGTAREEGGTPVVAIQQQQTCTLAETAAETGNGPRGVHHPNQQAGEMLSAVAPPAEDRVVVTDSRVAGEAAAHRPFSRARGGAKNAQCAADADALMAGAPAAPSAAVPETPMEIAPGRSTCSSESPAAATAEAGRPGQSNSEAEEGADVGLAAAEALLPQVLGLQQNGERSASIECVLASSVPASTAADETTSELKHPCEVSEEGSTLYSSAGHDTGDAPSAEVFSSSPHAAASDTAVLSGAAGDVVCSLSNSSRSLPDSSTNRVSMPRGVDPVVCGGGAAATPAASVRAPTKSEKQGSPGKAASEPAARATAGSRCHGVAAGVAAASGALAGGGGGATRKRSVQEKRCSYLVGRAGQMSNGSSWVLENRQKKPRAAECPSAWR